MLEIGLEYEMKLPSYACKGQPECDHLLGVTNQEDIANQHRMVPGLALDSREPCKLR